VGGTAPSEAASMQHAGGSLENITAEVAEGHIDGTIELALAEAAGAPLAGAARECATVARSSQGAAATGGVWLVRLLLILDLLHYPLARR